MLIAEEPYGSPQSYSWWSGQRHFINYIAYETSSLYKNANVHNDYHRCLCFIFNDDDDAGHAATADDDDGICANDDEGVDVGDDVYDYGVDGDDLGGCDNGNNDAAGDADDDEGVNGGGEDEGHRITYLPQQLQYWTTMKHGVLSRLGETSLNTHLNVSSYPLSRVPDCQYPVEEHP